MINKGDIWIVDCNGGVGSEQQGLRPCLVIQNDIGNKYSATTIVCPITTKTKNFNATHLPIDCLEEQSYIMFEQMRVVDKSRLKGYICKLDYQTMLDVNKKIKITLGL